MTHVESIVTQVEDGKKYKGTIELDGIKFSYTIDFKIPVNELLRLAETEPEIVRPNIDLKVTDNDGKAFELTKENDEIFMQTVVRSTIDFYFNPQTRESNQGILGAMARGRLGFRICARFSMTSEYEINGVKILEDLVNSYRKE